MMILSGKSVVEPMFVKSSVVSTVLFTITFASNYVACEPASGECLEIHRFQDEADVQQLRAMLHAKGERSLPVFGIIAGVPKNAIAVGADRTRDSLAATI